MSQSETIALLKTVEWERAKGSLRAIAALTGSDTGDTPREDRTERWKRTEAAVEAFIKDFEDEGFNE